MGANLFYLGDLFDNICHALQRFCNFFIALNNVQLDILGHQGTLWQIISEVSFAVIIGIWAFKIVSPE